MTPHLSAEYLEADGLGGFAMGTVSGIRTRRYHAILCAATAPPAGRMVLVAGFDAFVDGLHGSLAISAQRYAPDVVHPDGPARLQTFDAVPWPTWRYDLGQGRSLVQELVMAHGAPVTSLTWRLEGEAGAPLVLRIRPFLVGRDFHALSRENPFCKISARPEGATLRLSTYDGVPDVLSLASGQYRHDPDWYRRFIYLEEQARGLDHLEDAPTPGWLTFDLVAPGDEAHWLVAADLPGAADRLVGSAETAARRLRDGERQRREGLGGGLECAADAYVVRRGSGRTIIAGYPWFGDWGRDTFIALRGLCLVTGRLEDARAILVEWSSAVSEGLMPNRFPDRGETPEYNSVDAALWYVIAADAWLTAADDAKVAVAPADRDAVLGAVDAVIDGYARGTRYAIGADADGLLRAGHPGVQLTWMDAKVGDWVVTPRIGKPVEIQALWLNAVAIAARRRPSLESLLARGLSSFRSRFANPRCGGLLDVVDVDHVPGKVDDTLRPNQIFAVGGLPLALVHGDLARSIVDVVERELWTPIGLRSLAPREPHYAAHYQGGVRERDGAYHQGTVWPWLAGAFVEAWVRVHGDDAAARAKARERFLVPMRAHLGEAGLGHVSEIADAAPPHRPRGCPFQAWSVAELLRLERVVGVAAG